VTDDAHRIRYINGAGALLLGTRRDVAIGMAIEQLVGDQQLVTALRRAGSGEPGARASFEIAAHDGSDEGVLRISVRALAASGGSGAVGALLLIEDVTQQRLADHSRNAFVAQATHELRTPLTNVRLYVDELLEEERPTPELQARALETISHETRRLERMVGDMLSISEIEAGTMKLHIDDVRLEPMLRELERDFRAQAVERHIQLDFKLPPKFPTIAADRDKLQMTVANLLGNALKYTSDKGTVTFTLRATQEDVRFEIADSGIGIREEEHELIFRSFYRSKDTRIEGIAGTGLGLPIARQIARLHGGDITVSSVIDKGSTFSLRIPLRAPASGASSVPTPTAAPSGTHAPPPPGLKSAA
jgi:signal transduction histidine kinase